MTDHPSMSEMLEREGGEVIGEAEESSQDGMIKEVGRCHNGR